MTDQLRQAAQQALEAMGQFTPMDVCQASHHAKKDQHGVMSACPVAARFVATVEALRSALAAAQQAWPVGFVHESVWVEKSDEWCNTFYSKQKVPFGLPVHTEPVAGDLALLWRAREALETLMPDESDPNNGGYDARDVTVWRATLKALKAATMKENKT